MAWSDGMDRSDRANRRDRISLDSHRPNRTIWGGCNRCDRTNGHRRHNRSTWSAGHWSDGMDRANGCDRTTRGHRALRTNEQLHWADWTDWTGRRHRTNGMDRANGWDGDNWSNGSVRLRSDWRGSGDWLYRWGGV